MATLLGAQLSTFDLETVVPSNSGNPKGHMYGLRVAYGSATTITIDAGECRDSTDTYDLSLAALVTVSIATAGAALGLDETTLTATATTSAGTSATLSASIWSETPMTNTVKTLTGTITSSGTAITGSGTAFLSDLAVGDVLRSASNGAVRITAITSDTAATGAVAFPGGDIGAGQAITAYENLTIWLDTAQAADKRAPNSISHNGLTVVYTTNSTSNRAGAPVKVGVELASRWFYPWVVYGGSGTTGILSTQRTRPYGVTGYTTAWRRVPLAIYNDSSGNIDDFDCPMGGPTRFVSWRDSNNEHPILSASVSDTSYISEPIDDVCPPTACQLSFTVVIFEATLSSAGRSVMQFGSAKSGASDILSSVGIGPIGTTAGTAATIYSYAQVPVFSGGGIKHKVATTSAFTNSPIYLFAIGWLEVAS